METGDRTGSLLDTAAVASRGIENAIMGRNEGLPVSHLAEALLAVRPFEESSAAPSRFPMHGRTPVYLRGGLVCVHWRIEANSVSVSAAARYSRQLVFVQ